MSEDNLDKGTLTTRVCPSCSSVNTVYVQEYESDCGEYADEKYSCAFCKYYWLFKNEDG